MEHDPPGPVIIGPDDHYGFPLSGNSNYRPPMALASTGGSPVAANGRAVVAAVGWGPPPPYSSRGGSSSELGSISASTPMGLSPVRSPPELMAKVHSGTPTSGSSPSGSSVVRKQLLGGGGSMRKEQPQVVNLPPRRKSGGVHPSPVGRMTGGQDPRRMPWSPQTGISHSHSNSYPAAVASRSVSMTHCPTGSPTGTPERLESHLEMRC